jgi:nucleoside-diphosphate-sugar epimerase
MRIAVTGGSGRIGRAVVNLAVAQGHRVVSIDRVAPPAEQTASDAVEFVEAELIDYPSFERAIEGCEGLIHMAAIPSPRGFPDHVVHNNNVVSSYNALSAAARLGIMRVCQASSINATGASYSRWPRYDYFPLDEQLPTYNEDAYSLSKWVCEQQADSFVRLYETLTIASLRFHGIAPDRAAATSRPDTPDAQRWRARGLWGYTLLDAAARACLLSVTASFTGHEVFYIVAPETTMDQASATLKERYYPEVAVRGELQGHQSFYSSAKAEQLLGWKHDVVQFEEVSGGQYRV